MDFYKLALLGHPLGHSRSPEMHKRALAHCNLQGRYELIDVPESELASTVQRLKDEGYAGFNVTIPYKEKIITYLDEIDEDAQRIGAVNTVRIDPVSKKLTGYNTDMSGIVSSVLRFFDPQNPYPISGTSAIVLGSGGAARASIFTLATMGFKRILVCARNMEKACELVSYFDSLLKDEFEGEFETELVFIHSEQGDILDLLSKAQMRCEEQAPLLFVNATPLGQSGKDSGTAAFFEELISILPEDALVFDMVYAANDEQTPLIMAAKNRGMIARDGLMMLATQAIAAFEIWTGKLVTPEIMLGL